MKKLNPDHLEVSSFEPVAPPAKDEREKDHGGAVHWLSGAYGPDCASLWPNCNRWVY